ncbi:Short-chain dehydrogenase [Pseudomonas sp. 8AS]|uniref:SDR family NAD(P)-dependent oxidoreductase n=1 Tax=Pseudomonas sp. 8AS TaxID=2653163 RepID=UPI0012F44E52|nr:SDR family NAD(P)-dependent oxidoreductase [Pseudomonas sp. 8AS]VXC06229.1 Short-chain dehydrogenase [Pseudomonas sp. 8AS]
MPARLKRIVIIGATSAIAEHCARLWLANAPADITLVGRNRARTERVATDLRVRSSDSLLRVLTADFNDPQAIRQLVDGIVAEQTVDTVLIAHGSLPDQQNCQSDLQACTEALMVNGVSPVLFAEAFAGHMEQANHGTLAIIGSVAGDRGRKSNYAYGAAKGLITRYAEGLQHRLVKTAVKVVLIKPGPTDTPMTAHLKQQGGKFSDVADVARVIVDGIAKNKALVYAPGKWALIMLVIRSLPNFVFNKMDI